MNDDTIADLKQFIAATVSQQFIEFEKKMDAKLDEKLDGIELRLGKVEKKIDDLTDFVTEAIDTSNEETATQLKDHKIRITKLEQAKS